MKEEAPNRVSAGIQQVLKVEDVVVHAFYVDCRSDILVERHVAMVYVIVGLHTAREEL